MVAVIIAGAVSALLITPPLHHNVLPANGRAAPVVLSGATSFDELNVRPDMVEGLLAAGLKGPNAVQVKMIPEINQRTDLIIGAQTGSGKTLTYLVPTMCTIKDDEEAGTTRAKPRRPRAIVLVPTRELAIQVHGVAKSLAHHVKLSVAVVHGGVPDAPQLRRLASFPVDLLVATPGRLVKLMEAGGLYLGDVRHVVLDEVDTMFDAGFGPELDAVLAITTRDLAADPRARGSGCVQHLAVGATHPEGARALYQRWLGQARSLMVAGSHSLPPQLRQHFLTCNGPDAKMGALRDLLGPSDTDGRPTLLGRLVLFCNSQQSARFVDHTLSEEGFATANYHGAIPANERAANYEDFIDNKKHILVTTDLAARGLDQLDVGHVVQFDFAKSAADYVHRCGRTARAGKPGEVTCLVTKHDTDLVRAIRDAQKKGTDLVAAGEAQQKVSKARVATELQVANPYKPGRGGGIDAPSAAFPDSRGISNHEPVEGGRGGAKSGRGARGRVGGGRGGRGLQGTSRRGRGGARSGRGEPAPAGRRRRGS